MNFSSYDPLKLVVRGKLRDSKIYNMDRLSICYEKESGSQSVEDDIIL